jgi:hypothetical protein
LGKEIIRRFKEDYDKGGDKYTSVPRILYGMSETAEFNGYELLGAYQCWYFGATDQFKVETATCPPIKLHDHITEHAAKIDPEVVVQMDYIGNTPERAGTRFVCISDDGELISGESEQELNSNLCDETDFESIIEDGGDPNNFMTYDELERIIELMKYEAQDRFISADGHDFTGNF